MSVVEGRADIKICCVRSTSTGTRRVVRPSGWGVVNSLARRGCGPVGLIRTQKVQFFSDKKPHFGGRKLQDDLLAQADISGLDVRCLGEEQKTLARLELFSLDPRRT